MRSTRLEQTLVLAAAAAVLVAASVLPLATLAAYDRIWGAEDLSLMPLAFVSLIVTLVWNRSVAIERSTNCCSPVVIISCRLNPTLPWPTHSWASGRLTHLRKASCSSSESDCGPD